MLEKRIFEIAIQRAKFSRDYEVGIFEEVDYGRKVLVAKTPEMVEFSELETVTPTLVLSENKMQELFDELWLAGFRPKIMADSDKYVKAIESHLSDIRKLVFKDS